MSAATDNLRDNQKQLDADGCMVAVSRQAVDETLAEVETLKAALLKAEEADEAHANCKECEGEGAPEECGECFDLADDARLMRRAALASCKDASRK